eukprot:scaffold248386_cov92-Cyclotella_meneghiniana.AAC.2
MLCQKLGVCVLTSEERPHKLRTLVDKWFKLIIEGGAELNHQKLLSDQGFLMFGEGMKNLTFQTTESLQTRLLLLGKELLMSSFFSPITLQSSTSKELHALITR